jgi:hypothetical protein
MKRHWIFIFSIILIIGSLTAGAVQGAVPAIDLGDTGAYTYNTSNGAFMAFEIIVIDQDGISEDGTSHQVTVTYPDGTVGQIDFYGLNSPVSGNYWRYQGDVQPGTYIFTATDPEGNTVTETDELEVNILDPLDSVSFTPTLKNPVEEFITARYDNVVVNGQLFDDFDAYASVEEVDSEKWNVGSCEGQSGISIMDGAVFISQSEIFDSNSCWLSFQNPENITSIQADITVENASSGIPRGRIGSYFFNSNQIDMWAQINVTTDRVYYDVGYENYREYKGVQNSQWVSVFSGDLMEITPGQTVTAAISWDGSTLTFTANGNSVSYNPTGAISPVQDDFKGLSDRINLTTADTTPSFSWDPISGADRYRVRIYNYNGSDTVWRGWAYNQSSYIVPPGVLLPDTDYRYRIDVRDNHVGFDIENFSKAPADNNDNFLFTTGRETGEPFIDLDSTGIETWTDNLIGTGLDIWIKVHDTQGVPGNIKSVTVLHPSGAIIPLYWDQDNSENTSTSGIYRNLSYLPSQQGIYTFTVEDTDGNTASLQEELNPNPIGYPALDSLQPVNNAVINGTGVEFDWADVDGAAFYQLRIYDQNFDSVYTFSATESAYSLPAGFLKENTFYRYRIQTRREFFDENVDNGSTIPVIYRSLAFRTGPVTDGSHSPTIDLDDSGASISQFFKSGSGEPVYATVFYFIVGDQDGVPGNIDSVQVIYPDGVTTRELTFFEEIDSTHGYYWLEERFESPDLIPSGTYTFLATDFDGNTVQAADEVAVNILPVAENFNPIQDSVVNTATPVLFWDTVPGASRYQLRINDGWDGEIHRSDDLINNSYPVPSDLLQPGRTYSYRVDAYREPADADNTSKTATYWNDWNHFTVARSTGENSPPEAPVLTGPPSESVHSDGLVVLSAGAFSDPDGDSHAQTHWLVRRADRPFHADPEPDFNEITTGDGLTSYTLSNLDPGMKYAWKAGYMDTGSSETTWSAESNFKIGNSVTDSGPPILPGQTAADFQMVSITQWPDDPTAESVIGDDMDGEYDTRLFRIGTYDPMKAGGSYREYGEDLAIQPGRAYWIFARQGLDLTVEGVPVSTQHDIEVELYFNPDTLDGWNMIAPPNHRAYDWASVQIIEYDSEGGILFGPTAVGDLAEDNPYLDKRLWRWESGAYESDTIQMVPEEGYWVKTYKPNVYLRFPAGIVVRNRILTPDFTETLLPAGADWMHRLLPLPGLAQAAADDEPPAPISGFSGEPIELSSGSDSGGGTCFILSITESF